MFARISVFLLVVVIGLGVTFGLDYQRFMTHPAQIPQAGAVLEIPRGTSLHQLAENMVKQGILEQPYYFMLLAYQRQQQGAIKAGEYALTASMTPVDILDLIVSGKVMLYRVTLVEGWTFRQALEAIDHHPNLTGEDLATLSDEELMQQLGHPQQHPEGRLFPDTYLFPDATTRMEILHKAYARMEKVLGEEWQDREPDLPLNTEDEALTLASIIEKETAVPEERPLIGAVFLNRLQIGMRLQTDPTVIYGLGARYQGRLTRADLREPTPYNTYVISGLPPSPIALPGRASIHAALHPAQTRALYFVARGDGSHEFSQTLKEHNRAVRKYILGEGN